MKTYERIQVDYNLNGLRCTDTWGEGKVGFVVDSGGRLVITDGVRKIAIYEHGVWSKVSECDGRTKVIT